MTPSERAARLTRELRARGEAFSRLASLSREQARIAREEPEGLPALVTRKQAVMAEIEGRSAGAPGIPEEWAAIRGDLPAGEAAAVQAALDEVARILKDAMEAEDEARRVVETARDAVVGEVRAASDARRAAGAYRAPDPPPGPARLDLSR